MSDIVIIGGPNGAGKTTAAPQVVPQRLRIQEFVNADEIARGLSPFNPDGAALAAGRLMIERMRELVAKGESFAFETTCAGRAYAPWLRNCKAAGWRVTLLYLWLPSPQIAVARVDRRVRSGGHSIPTDVVIRRWRVGLLNMRFVYLPLANVALIYDNSDQQRTLIAEKKSDVALIVHAPALWNQIERVTS